MNAVHGTQWFRLLSFFPILFFPLLYPFSISFYPFGIVYVSHEKLVKIRFSLGSGSTLDNLWENPHAKY